MARNAVLTPPRFPRRLGRFGAIAKELARRVHRVTMLTLPGVMVPPRLVQAALPGAPAAVHPHRLFSNIMAGSRRKDGQLLQERRHMTV